MKLPVKNNLVHCPRIDGTEDILRCKKCYFLGWVMNDKVTCRWSAEKEELIRGERYYEISTI